MECENVVPTSQVGKSTYSKTCAVPGCTSKTLNKELCFHGFPAPKECYVVVEDNFGNKNKLDKLEAWMKAVKLASICKFDRICSLHFRKEDYFLPDVPTKKKKLIPAAVPTLNLPGQNVDMKKKVENAKRRKERLENRSKIKANQDMHKKSTIQKGLQTSQQSSNKGAVVSIEKDIQGVNLHESNLYIIKDIQESAPELTYCENGNCIFGNQDEPVQQSTAQNDIPQQISESDVIAGKKGFNFFKFVKSNKQLSAATGIETFDILETITKCYRKVVGDRFENYKTVMKTSERVLLVYVKLKHNITYSFLAIIFNSVSEQRCQQIFLETLKVLSTILKAAIVWPTGDNVKRNMPVCFKNFEDTKVVLDCTEIPIQRPKNLCCQILTYSHYKGTQTVKFMTGVTPAGDISFISKAYGGKASDSKIFEQSSITSLLQPGDGVMVDRGFLIEEMCHKNQWRLIRPPFLRQKKQFPAGESINTCSIAKARVHVERSNSRIKNFEIMASVMPVSLVPVVEDIMTVICGTVNLSSPILKDDKFMTDE